MDYETKQIFEQLIDAINNNYIDSKQLFDAINKLDDPDWGTIILTIINIGAFIWVAVTQIKLQRLQVRQQEYDIYRRLYSVIYAIDELSLNTLNIIDRYLSIPLVRASDKKILFHTQEKAMQLVKDLDNNAIDFDLKFSNGRDILDKYKKALVDITSILQYFISLEIDGHIALIEDNSLIYKLTFQEDEDVIINSIKDRIMAVSLVSTTVGLLNGYIERRNELLTMKIAVEIKKRITPIDA